MVYDLDRSNFISNYILCEPVKFKRLLVYSMLSGMVDYGIQSLAWPALQLLQSLGIFLKIRMPYPGNIHCIAQNHPTPVVAQWIQPWPSKGIFRCLAGLRNKKLYPNIYNLHVSNSCFSIIGMVLGNIINTSHWTHLIWVYNVLIWNSFWMIIFNNCRITIVFVKKSDVMRVEIWFWKSIANNLNMTFKEYMFSITAFHFRQDRILPIDTGGILNIEI